MQINAGEGEETGYAQTIGGFFRWPKPVSACQANNAQKESKHIQRRWLLFPEGHDQHKQGQHANEDAFFGGGHGNKTYWTYSTS